MSPEPPKCTEDASTSAEPWLQVLASRDFPGWLAGQHLSLALTTYQAGKLLLLGLQPDGAVRAGFVHYNTLDEVDRLLEALAAL